MEDTYGSHRTKKDDVWCTGWTGFKANILAAVAQGGVVGFDPEKEVLDRRREATKAYHATLGRLNGTLALQSLEKKEQTKKEREERTRGFADAASFLPLTHEVRPCKFTTHTHSRLSLRQPTCATQPTKRRTPVVGCAKRGPSSSLLCLS